MALNLSENQDFLLKTDNSTNTTKSDILSKKLILVGGLQGSWNVGTTSRISIGLNEIGTAGVSGSEKYWYCCKNKKLRFLNGYIYVTKNSLVAEEGAWIDCYFVNGTWDIPNHIDFGNTLWDDGSSSKSWTVWAYPLPILTKGDFIGFELTNAGLAGILYELRIITEWEILEE